MTAKGKGWLWAWGLAFPVPTLVLAVAGAAYVGTSFHSPSAAGIVGFGLFGVIGTKAWRDGPRFFAAFMCGIGAALAAAFGLVCYALTHMGPMG